MGRSKGGITTENLALTDVLGNLVDIWKPVRKRTHHFIWRCTASSCHYMARTLVVNGPFRCR